MKKKSKFSVAFKDERIVELVGRTDQKTLAVWAVDCVKRVMPYFEHRYPRDRRPRTALEVLRTWIHTGMFKMTSIRKASLDAHAAAREAEQDSAARSAARAAGQAVATAHVPTHSIGAANYALQAIHRGTSDADVAVAKERDWQYQHLLELRSIYDNQPMKHVREESS
ncbi:MAG: putative immunity protein [Candidatus Thorarchaeota archaeon]